MPGMSTITVSMRDTLRADQALGIGVGAGQQKQRPALGSAERACDRGATADVDAVGHGAAVDDALELVGQRHRRPDATFGVDGDAVRGSVEPSANRRRSASSPFAVNAECGQSAVRWTPRRSGSSRRRVMTMPLGKSKFGPRRRSRCRRGRSAR